MYVHHQDLNGFFVYFVVQLQGHRPQDCLLRQRLRKPVAIATRVLSPTFAAHGSLHEFCSRKTSPYGDHQDLNGFLFVPIPNTEVKLC